MEDAGPTGPCGTPCRECPERDSCKADCNAADGEEKKNEFEGASDDDDDEGDAVSTGGAEVIAGRKYSFEADGASEVLRGEGTSAEGASAMDDPSKTTESNDDNSNAASSRAGCKYLFEANGASEVLRDDPSKALESIDENSNAAASSRAEQLSPAAPASSGERDVLPLQELEEEVGLHEATLESLALKLRRLDKEILREERNALSLWEDVSNLYKRKAM